MLGFSNYAKIMLAQAIKDYPQEESEKVFGRGRRAHLPKQRLAMGKRACEEKERRAKEKWSWAKYTACKSTASKSVSTSSAALRDSGTLAIYTSCFCRAKQDFKINCIAVFWRDCIPV